MDEKNEVQNVNTDLQKSETPEASCNETKDSAGDAGKECEIDYGEIVKEDIRTLSQEFAELSNLSDISELDNPLRYAALRDLGLTPAEAYLATTKVRRAFDNRSHLYSSPMISSSRGAQIPEKEMEIAREIFSDMSDSQIRQLYKKVTK